MTSSIRVIVFSKDRPLQLDGYIASLLHHSGIASHEIQPIYVPDESYEPLLAAYPDVRWTPETAGFHSTLESAVAALDDDQLVLFGCDDVVYFRSFSTGGVADHMERTPDVVGFSLRLGVDVAGFDKAAAVGRRDTDTWSWEIDAVGVRTRLWGYPFELMGTVYRAGLIKEVLSVGGPFRGPNDLEVVGTRLCSPRRASPLRRVVRKLLGKPPLLGDDIRISSGRLAMFDTPSHCAAQDVNVVQDVVPNDLAVANEHDVELLKRQFAEGFRLDWQRLDGIEPGDCFIGDRYWHLLPPDSDGAPPS